MADQAAFEQSPGDWSVMRYSEDGESMMDRGHAEEQPKGGGVSYPSSRKHIVHAMPCVVNAGDIANVSDDDGNFAMTHARVEYIPSDDDDVEITKVIMALVWSVVDNKPPKDRRRDPHQGDLSEAGEKLRLTQVKERPKW